MIVTHKPKSGSLLTGTEYEASDSHIVTGGGGGSQTLEDTLALGNTTGANTIDAGAFVVDGTFPSGGEIRAAPGASVLIAGGLGSPGQAGQSANLDGGAGDDGNGNGAHIESAGSEGSGIGGGILLATGYGEGGTGARAGDIVMDAGDGDGAGRNGLVIIVDLPTSDPGVSGALWNDTGTVKVSP